MPENKLEESSKPTSAISKKERVDRFIEELTALDGQVITCEVGDLVKQVISLLHAHKADRVHLGDSVPGLTATELTTAGIQVARQADPEIRLGITGALAGIAESGSLVVSSGPGGPLTASLLPEIHIAVLSESQLVTSLCEALNRPEVRQTAASVIISGPSRTADIEMALTIGVHGPGELIVFLIDD